MEVDESRHAVDLEILEVHWLMTERRSVVTIDVGRVTFGAFLVL